MLPLIAIAAPTEARPKLVVGVVVDQMRWDYLYYYQSMWGSGGLQRMLSEGYSWQNLMIPYVPTVTAAGHTCVYTGSVPAFHGIAGNSFVKDGHSISSCRDRNVHGIGTNSKAGQASPRNLLANTIGDELKLATDFRAKVFGVAIKDRASILPAGHSADAAYWWDSSVGHFITSDYYMSAFPKWVEEFNAKNNTAPDFNLNTSNDGVTMTFKMAKAIVENEDLGTDDITDLLAVSVSSTDAIGHAYGTRGKENREVYERLDQELADFLSFLDSKVGRGNYLLFLTADHGGAHNPNFLKEHKQPAGGWDAKSFQEEINKTLEAKTGVPEAVKNFSDCRIYLNHHKIDSVGANIADVKRLALEALAADPMVAWCVDPTDGNSLCTLPMPLRERVTNGFNRLRSGDLMFGSVPGYLKFKVDDDYIGTTHSAWNPYDSHIPFIMMGWGVENGSSVDEVYMTDIAPTVCAMLHIQMPNACVGHALTVPHKQTNSAQPTVKPSKGRADAR